MTSDLIIQYFHGLSATQQQQFAALDELYRFWNAQINVISRKDIDQLYTHHILHSLAIAKLISFLPGEKILDVGTGGGFPGIPLAILFPQSYFHLVDSVGKKIKVVNEVAGAIGLQNLKATHARAEQVNEQFDFIVSRAVTQFKEFYPWVSKKFKPVSRNTFANGVFYLKGGDLSLEIAEANLKQVQQYPIADFFAGNYFASKYIIYFPAQ